MCFAVLPYVSCVPSVLIILLCSALSLVHGLMCFSVSPVSLVLAFHVFYCVFCVLLCFLCFGELLCLLCSTMCLEF